MRALQRSIIVSVLYIIILNVNVLRNNTSTKVSIIFILTFVPVIISPLFAIRAYGIVRSSIPRKVLITIL